MKTRLSHIALAAIAFCSASIAFAQLPPVRSQGDIQFITGGIGLEEVRSMKSASKDWPVNIMFSEVESVRGVWVSDVNLQILDDKGQKVLTAANVGPLVLVKLKPGDYTLQAKYMGKLKTQKFSVKADTQERVSVFWVVKNPQ